MQSDSRPGRIWYFASALLAIAGVAGAVALVFHLLAVIDKGQQFLAPGKYAFDVKQPGKHLVWNDYRTVFQGRAYDLPERLPDGLRIQVTETASGKPVEVASGRGMTSTTAEAERVSIASFEAAAPGRYEVAVEGEFAPRIFSVGPNILPRLLATIAGAVATTLLGLTVAILLALWTFLKRHPGILESRPVRAGAAPLPAPPPRTPEQAAKELATVVYALQAASFVLLFSLVAGVIVNYVTREQFAATWVESHYRWQVRTFWWWLAWALVGLALAFVLVGFVIWLIDAVWLIYRIAKGWIRLSEGKPMYEKQ